MMSLLGVLDRSVTSSTIQTTGGSLHNARYIKCVTNLAEARRFLVLLLLLLLCGCCCSCVASAMISDAGAAVPLPPEGGVLGLPSAPTPGWNTCQTPSWGWCCDEAEDSVESWSS
jgi:hypothetical protein